MTTTNAKRYERIADDQLTQRPLYLGTDADGAVHYWDSYEFAVCVVESGDATVYRLHETPCATLADWCQHVEDKRGWRDGPRCGGSIVTDLVEAHE